jgi:hypothetical protein
MNAGRLDMKNRTISFISGLLLVLAACRRDGVRHGAQQQYETVQEGQAAGVTSTIQGPGETVPPMTATNADTTSAFTINPALATGPATPPGTLAGALPVQPYGGAGGPGAGYQPPPMTSAARPAPTAQPVREQQPTYITPTQPQQQQQPPAATASVEPVAPAPEQTETIAPLPTTQTADKAEKPEKAEQPEKTEEKPPATDTQPTPPPPPPPKFEVR